MDRSQQLRRGHTQWPGAAAASTDRDTDAAAILIISESARGRDACDIRVRRSAFQVREGRGFQVGPGPGAERRTASPGGLWVARGPRAGPGQVASAALSPSPSHSPGPVPVCLPLCLRLCLCLCPNPFKFLALSRLHGRRPRSGIATRRAAGSESRRCWRATGR